MAQISALDWALGFGVLLLGWFLAVFLKAKYKVPKREFFAFSSFVAGLAAILIGVYHVLRGLLGLGP